MYIYPCNINLDGRLENVPSKKIRYYWVNMENLSFYEHAPVLTDFNQVADSNLYRSAPENWWVLVADISNSTEAIERGKYKEVNIAGASVIAAISNIFKEIAPLPFAFGGDGAVILTPDTNSEAIDNALKYCRKSVLENFGLEMKTGKIRVSEVREAGHEIAVAKLKLSDVISLPVFWGEGIAYAEMVIKKTENRPIDNDAIEDVSMEGLECRWKEIPPEHDEITSFIIKAAGESDSEKAAVYAECMNVIDDVYGSLENRNPVSLQNLSFTKSLKKLSVEWKVRTWKPSLKRRIKYGLKLAFQLAAGKYLMYRNIQTKNTDWGLYKSDLIKHADFRKFGDGLRFVISGTVQQRKKMDHFLRTAYKSGRLNYGIHGSRGLIITCYITDYHRQHVHFVDGMDGGYAMAAKMMKEQKELV